MKDEINYLNKGIQDYKQIFHSINDPLFILSSTNSFLDANNAALEILKIDSLKDLLKINPDHFFPKRQSDGELSKVKFERMLTKCFQEGSSKFQWMHRTHTKEIFLTHVTLKVILFNNQKAILVIWKKLNDIDYYKEQFEENNEYMDTINTLLRNKENKSETLLENIKILEQYKHIIDQSSIVSKADPQGVITYVNNKFCEISGYSRNELLGKKHNIIRHPDTTQAFFNNLWATISQKKTFQGIIKNRNKSGLAYYVDSTIVSILDKNENIIEYIAIRHDLTQLIEKDKLLVEQYTDELTQLPNRQKLLVDLKKQVSPKLSIVNIDRFRDVNSSYGFQAGDQLLRIFALELRNFESVNITIHRLYGDVFAILGSDNITDKELESLSKEILDYFQYKNFTINEIDFTITCTIGVSNDKKNLLSSTEMALMYAKQRDENLVIFNQDMPIYEEIQKNIQLTKDIKYAIENDGILLYGQKIINNITKEVKYETLMRMKNKDQILSPFVFLEHAEKAKLYPFLTRIMIEKACNYFQDKNCDFSLNLMIQDIANKETIDFLIQKLTQTKTANRVVLEIVESEGIENFEEMSCFIKRMKCLGCKVAIDDFGTGYSNFEYIIKLDIDILKIDGSLIRNIHLSNDTKLTVQTIVNFAKVLHKQIVAEFVHCAEVKEIVEELGIDFSQGYYFHVPEPLLL